MKAMIEAAARIKEIQKSTTISRMVDMWNEACCVSCRTEYCIAEGAGAKRKAAVIALIDDLLSRLTPETEQIAATLVTEGDVIYNAATGEQYQVMKATVSDPNTAVLANRGPQVFFDHDELVTVIKRDRRVHTRDDMNMVSIPAGDIVVGSYVYVCGYFRLVTKVTTLTNNVRYEGDGFSVILGKNVKVDAGATHTRADCVCEGQRLVIGSGEVVEVKKIRRESDNILELLTGGRWREVYNHSTLSVL